VETTSNLHKSDEGWRRLQDATDHGRRARGAFMRHFPAGRPTIVVENGVEFAEPLPPTRRVVRRHDEG
jgi:hypothetical protein